MRKGLIAKELRSCRCVGDERNELEVKEIDQVKEVKERRAAAALAGWLSINHDTCYHKILICSITIIVLVFGKLASFVRKILQSEENKRVELTGGRERKLEGRNWKVEIKRG